MSLRTRASAAVQAFRLAGQVEKTMSGAQLAWSTIFAAGLDQFFGSESLTQPMAQHPTIYAAVKAIASNLGALPLEMFPDSDLKHERPVKNSRVIKLLQHPNDDMTLAQLLEGTYTSLELWGDAFWFLDGAARRTGDDSPYPTKLSLWEASRVRKFTKTDGSRWYEYNDGRNVLQVPAAKVIRFYLYNPYDLEHGLAPLQAAGIIANADYKASIWNRAVFDNAAIPYGLITPKVNQITDKDAMVRVRDQIEQRHQGVSKRGRLGAVNVALDFLELGMSHKEMDFPLLLDAATERILMVFRVPPTVAGVSKNSNYQEATRQAKQFWSNHLPTALYVAEMIKRRLCEPFGIAETPYFKTEAIKALIEDQESLSNQARNYWNMGVPFEQINSRLELGFDTKGHVALETSWGPFSLVNMDDQALVDPAQSGPARGPVPGDTQNQPGDESTVADDPTQGKMHLVQPPDNREWNRSLSWRTLIGKVRDEELILTKRLREHFYFQRTEVLAALRSATTVKADSKPAEFQVEVVMYDEGKSAQDVQRRTAPVFKSAAEKGIESILGELRLTIDFSVLSPGVQQFLQDKSFEIVDLVDGPVAERLRFTLQEALSKGETIQQVADRVEEVFKVQRARAERIARTEVAESFNAGRFETMKEAGVQKIEWLTARDSRVRDSHVELDGDVVVVGDRFKNGLLYPLDPGGPPEEIVNCRCVALPAA